MKKNKIFITLFQTSKIYKKMQCTNPKKKHLKNKIKTSEIQ